MTGGIITAIYKKLEDMIGNTPVFSLDTEGAEVLIKLESFNPGGSIKDRAAFAMIKAAEDSGKLKKGGIIVEPTSGNTGVGLAMMGAAKGYKVIIVMPDTMSEERRKLIKAYGAELVLTEGKLGMSGAIDKAEEILKTTEGAFMPMQFNNPANPKINELTTAEEILRDTEGKLDAFVAGIGTGGTFTGISRGLKKKLPDIICAAVEPAESAIISGNKPGKHDIEGIGANFIPENFDRTVMDRIMTVTTEQSYETARELAAKHGLLVGISTGCAVYAAIELARELGKGKRVLCIAPDTGERYLSVLF